DPRNYERFFKKLGISFDWDGDADKGRITGFGKHKYVGANTIRALRIEALRHGLRANKWDFEDYVYVCAHVAKLDYEQRHQPRTAPAGLNGTCLDRDFVVEGLIGKGEHSLAYGAFHCGKTFVITDQGYHIARGQTWFGREVKKSPVIYCAYEGARGIKF